MSFDRIEKSISVLSNSKAYQWCHVNTENEFKFMNRTFVISENVDEYNVYNKAGVVEDFTNESYMEDVLAVIDSNRVLKFYNQNFEIINDSDITLKNIDLYKRR